MFVSNMDLIFVHFLVCFGLLGILGVSLDTKCIGIQF